MFVGTLGGGRSLRAVGLKTRSASRSAVVVILFSVILPPPSTYAADAETPPLSEEAFFTEVPVVLSVTRLVQPKSETPAAVTVIDREMIEASGARQIADLLRLVPGFQVGYVNGHRPTVTNHGMSDQYSRRMQVLIDGRSVYSPFFGTVFWSELPLAIEDIERIEVVRGPNAASYGANAVLGVINIITRHPPQDAGGFEKLSAGNHGILDGVVRRGWSGTDHSTRVTVGYRADDGFDTRPDSSRVPFLSLRSERQLTTSDDLEFQFGASKANSEEGFFTKPTSVPRDTTTITHFQLLHWSRRLDPDQEFSMQLFHNYRNHDEDFLTDPVDLGPLGIARVPISFDAFEERYDLELQHTLRASPNWRIVWGAGARLDRVRSQTSFNTSDTLENRVQRLFGNAEWRATKQAIVNAGVMVEKTSLADTDFSPRLALNYHLADEHTLRAAVSRASRTPFLLEVKGDETFFFNGVPVEQDLLGARDLKPEKMDSFEVGYLGRMLAGRLLADVRLFRDRLRDIITPVAAPSTALPGETTSFKNEGQVTVDGVDSQIDWRPDNDTRLALSYAYMRPSGSEVSVRTSLNQQARVTSVPHHTLGALVMRRLSNTWQVSALYYRVAEMLWLGDGDVTGRYGRLDLRLGRRLKFDSTRGELAVTIQNALDDQYVDFRQENIAGRRAFITFSLSQ